MKSLMLIVLWQVQYSISDFSWQGLFITLVVNRRKEVAWWWETLHPVRIGHPMYLLSGWRSRSARATVSKSGNLWPVQVWLLLGLSGSSLMKDWWLISTKCPQRSLVFAPGTKQTKSFAAPLIFYIGIRCGWGHAGSRECLCTGSSSPG